MLKHRIRYTWSCFLAMDVFKHLSFLFSDCDSDVCNSYLQWTKLEYPTVQILVLCVHQGPIMLGNPSLEDTSIIFFHLLEPSCVYMIPYESDENWFVEKKTIKLRAGK